MLVITVNARIPNISSIIAAPNIAFPERVDNFPSSFKVSTVILTEVAVKTIPINILCTVLLTFTISSFLNISATANPPKRGIITPNEAIINDAFPLSLSSSILLSKPAVNMSTITPNSAI